MTDQPTPPTLPPEGEKKPIWTRWWMIVIYTIVGLVVLGSLVGGDEDGEPVAAESTTTTQGESTETTAEETTTTALLTTTTTLPPTTTTTLPPTTTTTQPTTTTTLAPVEGSGDDFFEFSVPDDEPAVLDITHGGGSNFIVVTYDSSNERIDGLVNEIGSYRGRVPVNFLVGENVAFIEITASGPWSIETRFLSDLEVKHGDASGVGDDVIAFDVGPPALNITHDGSSNFIVRAWTDQRNGLVNEIGAYEGTVRSPTGIVVFEIIADGNWTISEG